MSQTSRISRQTSVLRVLCNANFCVLHDRSAVNANRILQGKLSDQCVKSYNSVLNTAQYMEFDSDRSYHTSYNTICKFV